MKFLLAFSLLGMVFACQQDEIAVTLGETEENTSEEDAKKAGVSVEYRYAKYKFIKSGYKDVLMAVRLRIDDNVPKKLELKDLKEGREEREIESANLYKVDADSSDTMYAFTGDSELEDDIGKDEDHGGNYTGTVKLNDDKKVADDSCCGDMTFAPNIKQDLKFKGIKETPAGDETFDAAWWNEVAGDMSQDFYGNYTFSYDNTRTDDDFDVVINLMVDENGKATMLLVKKGDADVGEVALSESGDSFNSDDGYTLKLAKNSNDEITGIAEIKYSDGTNDFSGTAGDGLDKDGWEALTCYALEMSEWMNDDSSVIAEVDSMQSLPRDIVTFTVTLKCGDSVVEEGDNASLKVTLTKRRNATDDYKKYASSQTYAYKSLEKGIATYFYDYSKVTNNIKYLQFKASITVNNNDISVEGDAFAVSN